MKRIGRVLVCDNPVLLKRFPLRCRAWINRYPGGWKRCWLDWKATARGAKLCTQHARMAREKP